MQRATKEIKSNADAVVMLLEHVAGGGSFAGRGGWLSDARLLASKLLTALKSDGIDVERGLAQYYKDDGDAMNTA